MKGIMFTLLIIFTFSNSFANASITFCPGASTLESYASAYIKNLKPVPFPQYYYMGDAVRASNECDVLFKLLSDHLLIEKNIHISNWSCYFSTDHSEGKPDRYTISFSAH